MAKGFLAGAWSVAQSIAYIASLRWFLGDSGNVTRESDRMTIDPEEQDFFERMSRTTPTAREAAHTKFNEVVEHRSGIKRI